MRYSQSHSTRHPWQLPPAGRWLSEPRGDSVHRPIFVMGKVKQLINRHWQTSSYICSPNHPKNNHYKTGSQLSVLLLLDANCGYHGYRFESFFGNSVTLFIQNVVYSTYIAFNLVRQPTYIAYKIYSPIIVHFLAQTYRTPERTLWTLGFHQWRRCRLPVVELSQVCSCLLWKLSFSSIFVLNRVQCVAVFSWLS